MACPQEPFPPRPELKRSPAYAPEQVGLTPGSTPLAASPRPGSMPGWYALRCPPPTESPFARREALPPSGNRPATPRPALPGLPRSYGLMRRTKSLPSPSVLPRSTGLCRLLRAPAGRWSFPTLSPRSLCGRLDPYPAVLHRCSGPFPSRQTSALPQNEQVRRTGSPTTRLLRGLRISGLQPFLDVQAPTLARPPDRAHRRGRYLWAAGPFTPRNARTVTRSSCGIATCLNRATDMARLSLAGPWPCRPLPHSREGGNPGSLAISKETGPPPPRG
jgi:hypothetical protein